MTTQFLTDDRGQKVAVVIPIADYEALMEDVADLAAVAERRDDDRISLGELEGTTCRRWHPLSAGCRKIGVSRVARGSSGEESR
ncbi:MAG: hypothetical protein U1G05_09865 [Kiritimatiellia bacterium]